MRALLASASSGRWLAASASGRCGLTLVADSRLLTSSQPSVVAVVGGQLSWRQPDVPSADRDRQQRYAVVLARAVPLRRGRDAPFTPRRSLQTDDVFVDSSDIVTGEAVDQYGASVYWTEGFSLDKSASLTGGIRYIAHRVQAETGTAVLTKGELYADVWSCSLPTPEHDSSPLDCDWAHS